MYDDHVCMSGYVLFMHEVGCCVTFGELDSSIDASVVVAGAGPLGACCDLIMSLL